MDTNLILSGIVIVVLTVLALVFMIKSNRLGKRNNQSEVEMASLFTVNEMIYFRKQYERETVQDANESGEVLNFPLWLKRRFDTDEIDDKICKSKGVLGIHEFFGLSYASYLVIPRSVLQSTSPDTQDRLIKVMKDIRRDVGNWEKDRGYYQVRYKTLDNKFGKDDLKDYEKGHRRVDFK